MAGRSGLHHTMGLNTYIYIANKKTLSLCIFAIILLELFQLAVGSVALFVFGGRTAGIEKFMLFIPFLSVPILVFAFRKIRIALWGIWILFVVCHAWYTKISWPRWEAAYVMLKLDWPLLAICILLTIIYLIKRANPTVRPA